MTWGGQGEIVSRLMSGYDPQIPNIIQQRLGLSQEQMSQVQNALQAVSLAVPIQMLPLQDCVDVALLYCRTTIETQRLTVGIRGCGGPIDVATITREEGFKFVQVKQIRGEMSSIVR